MNPIFDGDEILKKIVKPLLHWYENNSRILPWRENPSPYHTWISEIMLQQTRVEAVIPYYYGFLERFPNITALAKSSEDEVFTLWQGLGYYRRGAMLRKAAIVLEKEYGGNLPNDYDALLSLPGIGSYTAGAIASIGFGLPYPAVDGNVLRVICRLLASYENIAEERVKKDVAKLLLTVLPKGRVGDFNQSLMELGALICLPNGAPKCELCPLSHLCLGFKKDVMMELPIKEKKKPRRLEERLVYQIRYRDEIVIEKRGEKGLLANLWQYPNDLGFLDMAAIQENFPSGTVRKLGKGKHIFSHIEWHMEWYEIQLREKEVRGGWLWVKESDLPNYAIASAFKVKLK